MYKIRNDIDINTLIDGRTMLYLSQVLHYNRENLARILKGKRSCTYERAEQIVKYCKPNNSVADYFIAIDRKG